MGGAGCKWTERARNGRSGLEMDGASYQGKVVYGIRFTDGGLSAESTHYRR